MQGVDAGNAPGDMELRAGAAAGTAVAAVKAKVGRGKLPKTTSTSEKQSLTVSTPVKAPHPPVYNLFKSAPVLRWNSWGGVVVLLLFFVTFHAFVVATKNRNRLLRR